MSGPPPRAASRADDAVGSAALVPQGMFEFVVNSITDPISVVDETETYRLVNDAWCLFTRRSREQVIGRTASEVFPTVASPERRRALRECVERGARPLVRGPGPEGRGGGLVIETQFFPYSDPQAGWRGAVMISRDVTAEMRADERLRDSERRQRMLLDALPGYISALDADLGYHYVNDRLAELLGQPAALMIGRNAAEFLDPARIESLRDAVQRALAGGVATMERHLDARGAQPALDILITLARGEGPDGRPVVYAFGTDITALKRTEAALTAAKEEAERANRAKSQFLSNMSHELRTPLNAVLGFSQVLELNPTGNLGPEQLRQLGEIRRAGEHLLALIEDLLDLTRIEAGRVEVEIAPVALEPVLDECLRLVRPQAETQGVRIEAPLFVPTRRALADPRRLKQVLLNLLSNAIKYNRRGGTVTLACRLQADVLRIEVRDTGPGLDADQCAQLFRPFERLGAHRGVIQGTGIGLALSRQLIELMHGQIGVDSQPGRGSCFWLRLPAAAPIVRTS